MSQEQPSSDQRIFRVGDPGIPEEGILIGRGGRFTTLYDDFVLLPDGTVRFMRYMTGHGATIPEDFESIPLFLGEPAQYEEFIKELRAIDFGSMDVPPPTSTLIEYLVLVQKEEGLHAAVWSQGDGAVPAPLLAVNRSIRSFVTGVFLRNNGPGSAGYNEFVGTVRGLDGQAYPDAKRCQAFIELASPAPGSSTEVNVFTDVPGIQTLLETAFTTQAEVTS